jgi:hypothetical protein
LLKQDEETEHPLEIEFETDEEISKEIIDDEIEMPSKPPSIITNELCQYCGKFFYSKGTLTRHQKTIKYCMDLQLQAKKDVKKQLFKCESCGKCLSNKYNLTIHQTTCKSIKSSTEEETKDQVIEHLREKLTEKDTVIEKLEKRIRELELDMKDIALV